MPKAKTRLNNAAAAQVDNPQPQKRGSQKGATATHHEDNLPNNGQASEETIGQKEPQKWSHHAAAVSGNAEDAPPAKKGKRAKDAAAVNDPLIEKPTPSLPAPKATRPTRAAANAGKTADAPKWHQCIREEIAADKEAKCRAAKELIQKAEEAKAFLVQMDIDEEQADVVMERENPHRLSAVKSKCSTQVKESDGESFEEVSPGSEEEGVEMVVVQYSRITYHSPANVFKR